MTRSFRGDPYSNDDPSRHLFRSPNSPSFGLPLDFDAVLERHPQLGNMWIPLGGDNAVKRVHRTPQSRLPRYQNEVPSNVENQSLPPMDQDFLQSPITNPDRVNPLTFMTQYILEALKGGEDRLQPDNLVGNYRSYNESQLPTDQIPIDDLLKALNNVQGVKP